MFWQWLEQFYIGDLVGSTKPMSPEEKVQAEEQRKFELAYRDLRGKMIAAGLFKLNYWCAHLQLLDCFELCDTCSQYDETDQQIDNLQTEKRNFKKNEDNCQTEKSNV